ncbi:MAG: hypothetical protein IJN29_14980 [Akkermansia sp.]|nr:hypothetical protein [Akkermansia sp.]
MTHHLPTSAAALLAVLSIPQAADIVQLGGSLVGTALLVWIIVRKERDCERLRQENHELSRELGKKCRNCELAKAANELLADAGREHLEEKEKQ